MPELPEVETTARGLNGAISGLTIGSVWTDYNSKYYKGKDSIKDPAYFANFKKEVESSTIVKVERRAKNVLIHISPKNGQKVAQNKVILIHMKMTGHIMYGRYMFNSNNKNMPWSPMKDERTSLHDPFNRFVHFVIKFTNGRYAVLSDTRKFANVKLLFDHKKELSHLGPEPLDKNFTFSVFKNCLNRKPVGKIKTVLMDQEIVAGVGNIYSDEALWRAGIHPEERVENISDIFLKKLYTETIKVLRKGIDFGGDSMSDYRNIDGERGKFQEHHQVYRKAKTKCSKPGCKGIITRIVVGGRSAHFCSVHQKLKK